MGLGRLSYVPVFKEGPSALRAILSPVGPGSFSCQIHTPALTSGQKHHVCFSFLGPSTDLFGTLPLRTSCNTFAWLRKSRLKVMDVFWFYVTYTLYNLGMGAF